MQRLALIFLATVPLSATAQNEPSVAGNRPNVPIIEIQRTPERDMIYALRQVAKDSRVPVGVKWITGLEGADADLFLDIAYRTRAASEENSIRIGQELCDDGPRLTREILLERMVDAAENDRRLYEEAVSEVLRTFSPESVITLRRNLAALNYNSSEVDIELLYKDIEPTQFLEQACRALAPLQI